MRVIVLTIGRSGSVSLYHACRLARNFTAGHDTHAGKLAAERCVVADGHIEVDTRLAWFTGRLAEQDKGDVHYGFLRRQADGVAKSYNARWSNRKGVMRSYCEGLLQIDKSTDNLAIAEDMVETVELNIQQFLEGRPHSVLRLEHMDEDLPTFFSAIGADVDEAEALKAFQTRHNRSGSVNRLAKLRFRASMMVDSAENRLLMLRKRR